MPDNKVNERLRRLKAIDELFMSAPGKTFFPEEIMACIRNGIDTDYNRFKLSRDINFLKQDSHAIIKEEAVLPQSGKGRKITKIGYENPDASIFRDTLTQEDKYLIRDILDILQLKGIESIKSFVNFEKSYTSSFRKRAFPIISFTKNPSEKQIATNLNTLLTKIRHKEVVKIVMQDRETYSETTHIVHPWYLREYNRRWYLFGKENDEIRHYALDRITRFKRLGKKESEGATYEAADRSIDEILKDVVGISFGKGKVEEIIFWVSDKSSDFVSKKPIHKSQREIGKEEALQYNSLIRDKIYPLTGGKYFKIVCKINYELRREMMSFGAELIVLSPNKLREEIKQKLDEMQRFYR